MFGLYHVMRHARRWNANHKRAALERTILDLPIELQKDIGWRARRDQPTEKRSQDDIHARPIL